MKFECDNCNAQYMIADEKLGARGVKVKCKRCSHVIIVRPPESGGSESDDDEIAAESAAEGSADPFAGMDDGDSAAPFGDDGLGDDALDGFGSDFDGADNRGTAETPEFGGDTEVAGALGDTEVGDAPGDLDDGPADEEVPDRTMVTAAPKMTEEEDDAPAPPAAVDGLGDDADGPGFSDPFAGGADPFAGLSDDGDADGDSALGDDDGLGASDDAFGGFGDSDDGDDAFAGLGDSDDGDAFGGLGASDSGDDDAFGGLGGSSDGDEPAGLGGFGDTADAAFGDDAGATDESLGLDGAPDATDDEQEPPAPPAAEPPSPDPMSFTPPEADVPAPPPSVALPAIADDAGESMPETEQPSDMLDNELAGAFSAMFDPAAQAAAAAAATAEGAATEEGPDHRGPTKVLDLGAVDDLRAESARTSEGDFGGGGLDDLRADLDSSLGDGGDWGGSGPAVEEPEGEPEWHVAIDDEDVGPLTLKQISAHIEKGEVDRDTLAWKPGQDDWEPCGDVPELQKLFEKAPMPSLGAAPAGGAFDVGAPIDDLGGPSPFGGGGGGSGGVPDPFSEVGGGELTTDEPDGNWQPHGLTEVYQAANLAEAAAGVGGGGGAGAPAVGGSLDEDEDEGWKPGAGNALASLVDAELTGMSGEGAAENTLPPAADDSLNTPFGDGALGDVGSPPGLGDVDSLGGGGGGLSSGGGLGGGGASSGGDDALGGPPLGGGGGPGMGAGSMGGGMPLTPYASGAQPLHKNPLVIGGAALGGLIVLLLIVLVVVLALRDPAPAQPPVAMTGQPGQVPGQPPAPAPAAVPAQADKEDTEEAKEAEDKKEEEAKAAEEEKKKEEEKEDEVKKAEPKKAKVASRSRSRRRSRARATKREPDPPPAPKPRATRRDCDPILDLDCPDKRSSGGGGSRKKSLSPSDVLGVVRKNLGSVNRCGSKHGVSGTVRMEWRILKSGRTTSVRVMTPKYAGTPVGKCLESAIKRWKFPSYSGKPPPPVKFPFKLRG